MQNYSLGIHHFYGLQEIANKKEIVIVRVFGTAGHKVNKLILCRWSSKDNNTLFLLNFYKKVLVL